MKRNLWLILIPILVTGLCTALSFAAGRYVRWTPLGTPPEPAVGILRASQRSVIVVSNSDQIYMCAYEIPFNTDFPEPYGCIWQKLDRSDFSPGGLERRDEQCYYLVPPGRVADHYSLCSGPDYRYVVLTDGSVWRFHLGSDPGGGVSQATINLMRFFGLPILGLAVGLILGIVTFFCLLWLRRRRQS